MSDRIPDNPPEILPVIDGKRPLWSVMIPVYNCYDYIREALESVLSQDPGIDLMQIEIVDDHSNDGDVLKLVDEIGKGRVGYYRQKTNSGSLRNFETCINRAKGHYVHILHGDDKVLSGFYEQIGTLFNTYPEAGAAFTNFNYIDHNSNPIPITNKCILATSGIIPDFLSKIAIRQLIQPPAIIVKRSTYEQIGSFYAVHFGEDWEMWTRIARSFPVAYSPKYLASYRAGHGIGISHESFLTGQNITDMKKVIDIISQNMPQNERSKTKRAAAAYYAIFCVRIANGLLLDQKDAAFKQIKGALNLNKGVGTMLWVLRFYAMYVLRYKQISHMLQNTRTKTLKKHFDV
jgi:glycosyltransferase involved in cell wall biosynthesis